MHMCVQIHRYNTKIYIHRHTGMHMHTHTYTQTHTDTDTYTHTQTHTHIHTHTYTHIHTPLFPREHAKVRHDKLAIVVCSEAVSWSCLCCITGNSKTHAEVNSHTHTITTILLIGNSITLVHPFITLHYNSLDSLSKHIILQCFTRQRDPVQTYWAVQRPASASVYVCMCKPSLHNAWSSQCCDCVS